MPMTLQIDVVRDAIPRSAAMLRTFSAFLSRMKFFY